MELKDIVKLAGNENVNEFQNNVNDILMVKVNTQINNVRQEIMSQHGKPAEQNVQ